jgi:hypothetical protein
LLEFLHARGKGRPLLIIGYRHTIHRMSQAVLGLCSGPRAKQRTRSHQVVPHLRGRAPPSSVCCALECDLLTTGGASERGNLHGPAVRAGCARASARAPLPGGANRCAGFSHATRRAGFSPAVEQRFCKPHPLVPPRLGQMP